MSKNKKGKDNKNKLKSGDDKSLVRDKTYKAKTKKKNKNNSVAVDFARDDVDRADALEGLEVNVKAGKSKAVLTDSGNKAPDSKVEKFKKSVKKRRNGYIRWEKLDNTAHVFPTIAGEDMTNVYRISVTLNEPVDKDILQQALDILVPKIDGFNVRLRKGIFWYYLEENTKPAPRVREEDNYPCRYIVQNRNNSYLFRVTYYKARINLEVYHVLADGMGGINFLKELTYQYLRLAHKELSVIKDDLTCGTSLNREDAFVKNYRRSRPSGFNRQKAAHLKFDKLPKGEFGMMHVLMSVKELKAASARYGASINEYLAAVFAWAIYEKGIRRSGADRPIRIAVPVNLRPYFKSNTTKNFFVMVSAEMPDNEENYTFEQVIEQIKESLRSQIDKDKLENLFSYSVSNQMSLFLRLVPLMIKNIVIKFVYEKSAMANTATMTNIGNIKVDEPYAPYITHFYGAIAMSKGQSLKGTICSYKDTLNFTFSTIYVDTSVQYSFINRLNEDDIRVSLETNGVF